MNMDRNRSTFLVTVLVAWTALTSTLSCQAFAPGFASSRSSSTTGTAVKATSTTSTYPQVDERTGKPTGVSFLPADTIQRALDGSPVEKVKLEKDGTSAFVDVYEYARRIRAGEITWEEVDKADLDSVRRAFIGLVVLRCCCCLFLMLLCGLGSWTVSNWDGTLPRLRSLCNSRSFQYIFNKIVYS